MVNEQKIEKAGTLIKRESEIKVLGEEIPYVSRGGLKLEKAIDEFQIDLKEKICVDIGASTGGFTDCMLQHEAKKIYAIDVGYGQLAWKLRNNEKVINMERTNIRKVKPEQIEAADFIAIDAAFISLEKILPIAKRLMKEEGEIVALIKPQFEAGREKVGKGGIVREEKTHIEVIEKIITYAKEIELKIRNLTYSPIKGAEGNIEYLIEVGKTGESREMKVKEIVRESHENK